MLRRQLHEQEYAGLETAEMDGFRQELDAVLHGERTPSHWQRVGVSEEHTTLFRIKGGKAFAKLAAPGRREAATKIAYEHAGLVTHLQHLDRREYASVQLASFRGNSGLLTPNLGQDAETVFERRGKRLTDEQFAMLVEATAGGMPHGDLGLHNLLVNPPSREGLPACFIDFTPQNRLTTPMQEGLAEIGTALGIAYDRLPRYLRNHYSAGEWRRLSRIAGSFGR